MGTRMSDTIFGVGKVIRMGKEDGKCQNRDDKRRRCRNDAEHGEKYCSFCLELMEIRGRLAELRKQSPVVK